MEGVQSWVASQLHTRISKRFKLALAAYALWLLAGRFQHVWQLWRAGTYLEKLIYARHGVCGGLGKLCNTAGEIAKRFAAAIEQALESSKLSNFFEVVPFTET
jgi:hypothetical protein